MISKSLIYFPIVHTSNDMGSMSNALSLDGENKYGKDAWKNHLMSVDASWNKIEELINITIKDIIPTKIKIYQDGMPVNGEAGNRIVKQVSQMGSKNYKIIENLLSLGAILENAENKELLIKEYELFSNMINAKTTSEKLMANIIYLDLSKESLNNRDSHIANQINLTLNDGEIGIAFFGATHSIIEKLSDDIDVHVIKMFNDEISLKLI